MVRISIVHGDDDKHKVKEFLCRDDGRFSIREFLSGCVTDPSTAHSDQDTNTLILIASDDDGGVIGAASASAPDVAVRGQTFYFRRELDIDAARRDQYQIHGTSVSEDHRDQPIGAMLVQRIEDYALQTGRHSVFGKCQPFDYRFYRNLGYQVSSDPLYVVWGDQVAALRVEPDVNFGFAWYLKYLTPQGARLAGIGPAWLKDARQE